MSNNVIVAPKRFSENCHGQELQDYGDHPKYDPTLFELNGGEQDDDLDVSDVFSFTDNESTKELSPTVSPAHQDDLIDCFDSISLPSVDFENTHDIQKLSEPLVDVTVSPSIDISSSGPMWESVLENRKTSESSSVVSLPISDDGYKPKTRRTKKEMDRMSADERVKLQRDQNREAATRFRKMKIDEEAQLQAKVEELKNTIAAIRKSNKTLEVKYAKKIGDPVALRNAVAREIWTGKRAQRDELEAEIRNIADELVEIARKKEELDDRSAELKKLSEKDQELEKKLKSLKNTNGSAKCRAGKKLKMAQLRQEVFNKNMLIEELNKIQGILEGAIRVEDKPAETTVESDDHGPPLLEAQESPKKYFPRGPLQCHRNTHGPLKNSTLTTLSTSPPLIKTNDDDNSNYQGEQEIFYQTDHRIPVMGELTEEDVMRLTLDNNGSLENGGVNLLERQESYDLIDYIDEEYQQHVSTALPSPNYSPIGGCDEDDVIRCDSKARLGGTHQEYGGGGSPHGQHTPLLANNAFQCSGRDHDAGRLDRDHKHSPVASGVSPVLAVTRGDLVSRTECGHLDRAHMHFPLTTWARPSLAVTPRGVSSPMVFDRRSDIDTAYLGAMTIKIPAVTCTSKPPGHQHNLTRALAGPQHGVISEKFASAAPRFPHKFANITSGSPPTLEVGVAKALADDSVGATTHLSPGGRKRQVYRTNVRLGPKRLRGGSTMVEATAPINVFKYNDDVGTTTPSSLGGKRQIYRTDNGPYTKRPRGGLTMAEAQTSMNYSTYIHHPLNRTV